MMSCRCTVTMNRQEKPDIPFSELVRIAGDEIHSLHTDLPSPLSKALERIPVILENLPSPTFLQDGIEPDQLGLFEGSEASDTESPTPARIVLWLGNLWYLSEAQVPTFRSEVRTTLLHELGHYLGFDEAQIDERGLG